MDKQSIHIKREREKEKKREGERDRERETQIHNTLHEYFIIHLHCTHFGITSQSTWTPTAALHHTASSILQMLDPRVCLLHFSCYMSLASTAKCVESVNIHYITFQIRMDSENLSLHVYSHATKLSQLISAHTFPNSFHPPLPRLNLLNSIITLPWSGLLVS